MKYFFSFFKKNQLLPKFFSKKCPFFEYAIDNKWVQENPTRKVVVKARDRKIYSGQDRYKALTPEARKEFLTALNQDEANFLKPLCYVLLFAGLRIGEAIALQWKNVNFENKTLKVERSVTQIPKFDSEGRILSRATVIGIRKLLVVLEKSQLQTLLSIHCKLGKKNKLIEKRLIKM